MEPQTPTHPQSVMIGEVEARLLATQPSEARGEATTLQVVLQHLPDGNPQTERYRALKDYQQYAGEADFGNLMGGKPHLREHPQDYWPVESHVVPITTGSEIYEIVDFWGLIDNVDDSETVIVDEPGRSNHYQLTIDIISIADIAGYQTRDAVIDEYSPRLEA